MDVASIGLIEDEDILLDLASLALSHLDHENTDIAPNLQKLEKIEDRLCHEGRNALLARECAAVLSRVLHGEFGFIGDTETYDAPVNADFICLLDRKRGLRSRYRSCTSPWHAERDGTPVCSVFRAMCWSRSASKIPR